MLGFLPYAFIALIGFMLYAGRWRGHGPGTCLGLAIGIESLLLFVLGIAGLFRAGWIALSNCALLAGAVLLLRPSIPRPSIRIPRDRLLPILVVFLLLSVHAALLPRKGYDAYKYHYYQGRIIALDGGLPAWGEVYDHHWFFPQAFELILASCWAFDPGGYRAAYFLSAFVGIVCALGLMELAPLLGGGRRSGILAAIILFATPLLFTHATNGYNDLLLGAFTLLGFANLLAGRSEASGILFGLGAWVKVFGLINILFLAILASRRPRKLWRGLLLACLVASLFFARNTAYLGDPVSVYGGENLRASAGSLLQAFSDENIMDNLGWWFLDYSGGESYVSLTHKGLSILLPVFILYWLLFIRPMDRRLPLLALVWILPTAIYCNLGGEGFPKQIARYIIPCLLPLCAGAAVGLEDFLDRRKGGPRGSARVLVLGLAIAYPSLAYATIPALDAIKTTGSLLPGEDAYFRSEYPGIVGLSEAIGADPYSVHVGWTGMEVWPNMQVAPYQLRQRRAEWPDMWTVRLEGMPADRADYVLVPGGIQPPDHLSLSEVLVSEEYGLYEVLHND